MSLRFCFFAVVVSMSSAACGRLGYEELEETDDGGSPRDAAGFDAAPTDGSMTMDSSVESDAGAFDSGTAATDGAAPFDSGGAVDGGVMGTDASMMFMDSGPMGADSGDGSLTLVINELMPQDGDYAEIVNTSALPLSLDGLSVADGEGIGSPPPDPSHRTAIPAGITLAPGEHFVIAMNFGGSTRTGLQTSPALCRGAPRCIQTSYGLSVSGPDTFAVLRAGVVLVSSVWLGEGPTGLRSGESWCRLPDVTGAFGRCSPTAGAVNAP